LEELIGKIWVGGGAAKSTAKKEYSSERGHQCQPEINKEIRKKTQERSYRSVTGRQTVNRGWAGLAPPEGGYVKGSRT